MSVFFLLKVKFFVTYWTSRWILNFQLKGAFVEKWILNLPLNIEFRLAEFMNTEHDEVSIEYCFFGRILIFVKIMNFRWILDFRLNVEFGHRILFFFSLNIELSMKNQFFVEYRILVEFWNFILNIEFVMIGCWIFVNEYWILNILNFAKFGVP